VKSLQAEGTMTHAPDIREQTLLRYAGSSAASRLASISARQDFWCEVPVYFPPLPHSTNPEYQWSRYRRRLAIRDSLAPQQRIGTDAEQARAGAVTRHALTVHVSNFAISVRQ